MVGRSRADSGMVGRSRADSGMVGRIREERSAEIAHDYASVACAVADIAVDMREALLTGPTRV
jgi:hypothetical protein